MNNRNVCECVPGYYGNPNTGCKPECTINTDCSRDRACSNNKCVDPCPGICGYQAICHTNNHSPICSCPDKMIGNPYQECKPMRDQDPCNPSPCAENGICQVRNNVPVCVYPECIINSDCSTDRACYNQKCHDPCINACGLNAICSVINHRAKCSCPDNYEGSPYIQCTFRDTPILVRPECEYDSECSNDKACINQKCQDPCIGVCGQNAECRVQQHRPFCVCREGYTGNAQFVCTQSKCFVS